REYGLHTDSSHRFERGVDPELPAMALQRATQLLIDICGGQAGPVVDRSAEADLPQRKPIELRLERVNRMLGIAFNADEVEDILTKLGMALQKTADDEWRVTAPGFRFDIAIEADLIEEIVRIHGYNKIPRTLPYYQPSMKPLVEAEVALQRVKSTLVERGYHEAISYSFVDPRWQAAINPDIEPVKLANPISADLSVMRTSIWPGLLKAVQHNLNRQQPRVRLFETGLTFVQQADELVQHAKVSGVITGTVVKEQWSADDRKVDFFDAKADLEAILSMGGLDEVYFEKSQHPALHPGQSAQIFKKNKAIGWIGALHPNTRKTLDIDPPVYLFEVDQKSLLEGNVPAFKALSKFPEVRRDLAILVKQEISVEELVKSIKSVTSEIFQEIILFDVYTGERIEAGLKSVALGLILQGFSSTLTDEDVEKEIRRIITVLNDRYGATLRE
ncbi:Phenylalanyl-tRNA synthetase beta chain, partial [hydrothermal vent metagenome]